MLQRILPELALNTQGAAKAETETGGIPQLSLCGYALPTREESKRGPIFRVKGGTRTPLH